MDALRKLEYLVRCGRYKKNKTDLLVIRINKNGGLCESAPCQHCTKELSEVKFIKIDMLYYSRADGTITCIKFSEYIKQETIHISKGWKWINERNCTCKK
jgi:hypothetical protein